MKITIRKYFFLFFITFHLSQLSAQLPYYYKITEENGLPSSEVYQIIQDDFGYIWVGSDAGLYRYDGVRFKLFTSQKQNSKSVSGIKIDKDKTIWCQNFSGQILKVSGDSLSLVIDISKNIASYSQYTIDKNQHLWIANNKSIELFDLNGNLIRSFIKVDNNKDTISWQEIEVNKKGEIYVASNQYGIGKIETKGSAFDVTFFDSKNKSNTRTSIEPLGEQLVALTEINPKREYTIIEIIDGNVFERNKVSPFTKEALIYKIYKDNLNRNWLCGSTGIVKLSKDFKFDNESVFFFTNDKISSIYQDREGNLWVSSLQNGIYVIPNYDLKIYDQYSSIITDANITTLLKTRSNKLLAGSYNGCVYELGINNEFNKLQLQSNVSYRTVKKIQEKDGGLYVAHGPISFYSGNKETVFNAFNFRDFCWIVDTMFFVSSHMFGSLTDFHKTSRSDFGNKHQIIYNKGSRALTLNEKTKAIYFASIDGLFSYKNGKINEIKIQGKSVFVNKLMFVDDVLWIATVNDGQYALKNDLVIEHYYGVDLMNGNAIKSFKVINGNVFVVNELGLFKVNRKTRSPEFYNYLDGVSTKEINDIEIIDSAVYLATNKGLIKFPDRSFKNLIRPNIKIISLEINHHSQNINSKMLLGDLAYNQNNIIISFLTACFRSRGTFKYKYRLLGIDSNWVYNSALDNQVQYSALPSGNFTFEVMAVNEDGIESLNTERIAFCIHPPFWQRWWFYLLIVLVTVFIAFIISLKIIQNFKKKSLIKNELVNSKLTAIRAQMNPHFMYNTLNSIQDLILKNDIKNTNYFLSKFSSLMRKVLEFSENEEVVLSDEIEMLNSYLELEKLRFGNDFSYSLSVASDVNVNKVFIPSLILQPFIENAMKHGLLHKKENKQLTITFKKEQNYIVALIEDNGVGRKRSAEIKNRSGLKHKSFAVSATQKRLDLLNQEKEHKIKIEIIDLVNENEATGTLVKLCFPIISLS